jgi:hydroxymethylpyrimidine pyrophosphatase-like HAD family hydrolase
MKKQKYVVCDLDGALCDHRHRLHLAWLGKWAEYNAGCKYDVPINETVSFLHELSFDLKVDIIFLTGRSIAEFLETRRWLDHHVTRCYKLIMRQLNDYRSATDFKKAELTKFLVENEIDIEQVDHAIDDDADCCKMFKELGIKKVIQYGK